MGKRGRQQLIDSINALTGGNDCTEAVAAAQSPAWMRTKFALPAMILAAGVLGFIFGVTEVGSDFFGGFGAILSGAILGGLIGLAFTMMLSYFVIARVGDEVVVASKSRWTNKAVELLDRYPVPLQADISKHFVQSHAKFGGRTLSIGRTYVPRFHEIIG